VGFGLGRRDRAAEPVVDRRIQDANNMMQTFQEENRSARKTSGPRRADRLPGLAASIPFRVHGFDTSRRGLTGRLLLVWPQLPVFDAICDRMQVQVRRRAT
jgi:hypothetical protein